MEKKLSTQWVTAIVPAHNEADRIGAVIETLLFTSIIGEIIVVDDGSTDGTWDVITSYPIITLRTNQQSGKAAAMDLGVRASTYETIFFCDADVRGLTEEIVEAIILPVTQGTVEMSIGMRNRKILFLKSILHVVPHLGGERALKKALWQRVPAIYKQAFRIETALNFYAVHGGRGYQWQLCYGLTQTIKEKKYGLYIGLKQRLSMCLDIIYAQVLLTSSHTILHCRRSWERMCLMRKH